MLFALVLSIAAATAATSNPAMRLGQRAPYAGGGWALLISGNNDDCPTGTTRLDAGVDFGGGQYLCCPNGFQQQGGGSVNGITCCPSGSSCLDALQANPFCADSTWVLWNATTQTVGSGYFCCLASQIGTQDMSCDSAFAALASTMTAEKLGQPTPAGAAGATLSVSAAAGSTITSVATATTTTKGSLGGAVSSLLSGSTKKSDSSKNIPPLDSDIFKVMTLFAGFGLAGFGGLIAMVL